MNAIESIIEQINKSTIDSPCEVEDAEDIDWPEDAVKIATLDYLWLGRFIIATMVYQIGDRFLGVKGPIELLSESIDYSDWGGMVEAFEVEAVPSVTYKAIGSVYYTPNRPTIEITIPKDTMLRVKRLQRQYIEMKGKGVTPTDIGGVSSALCVAPSRLRELMDEALILFSLNKPSSLPEITPTKPKCPPVPDSLDSQTEGNSSCDTPSTINDCSTTEVK